MKKYIYSFLLNILVFSFVLSIFKGVSLPSEITYAVFSLFIFSFAVLLHRPFLRFLTVKINFVTYWLSVALLVFGTFFLLQSIMPGFSISNTVISEMDFQVIKISSFEMNPLLTMIFASIFAAFVSGIMEFLQGRAED